MKRVIFFSILITFIVFNAFSQPFGIRFGMNLEELKTVAIIDEYNNNGKTIWITPYKKSSSFTLYGVRMSPTYGVYYITAMGTPTESDEYGDAIKSQAQKLVKQLTDVYGKPDLEKDKLKEGSIWTEPRDWLTSLRKGERDYLYLWYKDLPNRIKYFGLGISFLSSYPYKCYLDFNCFSLDSDMASEEIKEENPF